MPLAYLVTCIRVHARTPHTHTHTHTHTTQPVKWLAQEQKDLDSDLHHPCKNSGMVAHIYILELGR